ncbi:Auxin-responsive protein SAUR50 [Sesamum alatum]|uniref:Auxin-responsive protein SAUR50 n=1 Tax=Sesamum alatum TaxID=300844 RepID=A0AAE1XXF2_9LAMI|nr:Auxin-responsive protein SAUR50 [Sesamum alatum]
MKKLARKVKSMGGGATSGPPRYKPMSYDNDSCSSPTTPTGTFPVYVGEKRQRFVVPMRYLSHPLFKIMLEKAYDEFGFEQRNGLSVPCSVHAFLEMISAVECCSGGFDFGDMVDEFL